MLIQNKAILETFNVVKTNPNSDGVIYEFQNKETGNVLRLNKNKARQYSFKELLITGFFPNSVLILTEYASDPYADVRDLIRKHFNYKGLKLSTNYGSYFTYEGKPRLEFGEEFYGLRESILNGQFNRRYVDSLIDQVLPLIKDEVNAFRTFFEIFSPDYALRGKFTLSGNSISNHAISVFSNSSKVDFDFDLTSLHGKLLVGESGIELIDSSFVANFEELFQGLDLGKFQSQVPVNNLTTGEQLSYNEDMFNFGNWFYSQNNLVNV